MGWGSFDDATPLHAKVLALSDGAYRLWTNIIHHCNRSKTRGVIPKHLVPSCDHRRGWTNKQIESFVGELTKVQPGFVDPLLLDDGDSFRVHDYDEHQQYSSKQADKKAVERERKADYRRRSRDNVPSNVPGTTAGQSSGHEVDNVPPMSHDMSGTCPSRASDRDPDPTPDPKSTTYSLGAREDFGPGMSPAGNRAEALRSGFESRFRAALPKVKPESRCKSPVTSWWLDLARELEDVDVSSLLDAAFADDFVRKSGFKTGAMASERVRLLGFGPTVNGEAVPPRPIADPADPVSVAQAARDTAEKALRAARLHRDSVSGTEAFSEASRAHGEAQRALAQANAALEALDASR